MSSDSDRRTISVALEDPGQCASLCGPNDSNLRVIEDSLGGRVYARGNEIRFEGGEEATFRFNTMIDGLLQAVREGDSPTPEFTASLAKISEEKPDSIQDYLIHIPRGFGKVHPRSRNQADYIKGIRENDICFCVGPAGTGKTYLAIAEALSQILAPPTSQKKMRKLILTRPVVEAGESLGFLPGDLIQKINPYLRPLYDAMEALIPFDLIRKMEEDHIIEIAPLAYMRGRSLNHSIIILDEAQNTTKEQMKMFLTRIGEGSRALITGDATQVDLPKRVESGLLHAISILKDIQGIHIARLHTIDVVRHPLIKKIIDAYEAET